MSIFVTYKNLKLFVNTSTVDDKYSLLNRDNLTQQNQMHLSQKQKKNFQLFCAFLKSKLNCEHFKKKMTLIACAFPKNGFRKTSLDKCLKSPVSQDPSTGSMVNGLKTLFQSQRHDLFYIY